MRFRRHHNLLPRLQSRRKNEPPRLANRSPRVMRSWPQRARSSDTEGHRAELAELNRSPEASREVFASYTSSVNSVSELRVLRGEIRARGATAMDILGINRCNLGHNGLC